MSALAAFQDDFVRAIGSPPALGDLPNAMASLAAQPGFAVYRNTGLATRIDALEAGYPAVVTLVGREWFRAAASTFADTTPAASPMMVEYGDEFPSYLRTFGPARYLPFLAPVALIDLQHGKTQRAGSVPALTGDALLSLAQGGPAEIGSARLTLRPSTRFARFDTNAPTVWLDARGMEVVDGIAFGAGREAILLTRRDGAVLAERLTEGAFALLEAIRAGATIAAACELGWKSEPDMDALGVLNRLVELGTFAERPA